MTAMTDAGIPMGEVLKPCPFCGGEAEEFTEANERIMPLVVGTSMDLDVYDEGRYFGVKCSKCDIGIKNPFVKRADAIAAWNTRAFADTPPPAAAGDRSLAEAIARLDLIIEHECIDPDLPFDIEALRTVRAALRTPEPDSGGEPSNG
jgi:Lar family restriction alleviation protein